MSAPVGMQVSGADDVARRLGGLQHDVDDLQGSYLPIAQRIASEARSYAPKVSGALASTIVGSATRRAGGAIAGPGIPYAGVINFGWRHRNIAAALFMQRAADNKGDTAADAVAHDIQRDIDKRGL